MLHFAAMTMVTVASSQTRTQHFAKMTMMRPVLAVVALLFLTQEAVAFHHQPSFPTARQSTPLFSVRSAARRVRDSVLSRERSREDLKIGIAGFYDRSSELWENIWGEHMHHGVSVVDELIDFMFALMMRYEMKKKTALFRTHNGRDIQM